MKVPQNLHHLPPLGVVGLVLPIELKKIYIIQKKYILQVRLETEQTCKEENLPH